MDPSFDSSTFDDPWEQMDPEQYYEALEVDAWDRLGSTFVTTCEFEHTIDELDEWLPDDGRVLDAGGGTGRYAVWMAERGLRVRVADLSRSQLDRARIKARDNGCADAVATDRADVSSLPYRENSFSAVCALGGALSHLVDEARRREAVRELERVGRPGAPVLVSVGGRLGYLASSIREGLEHSHPLLPAVANDGDLTRERLEEALDGPAYTSAHFFRVDELDELLQSAGLEVNLVTGLEGIASLYPETLEDAPDEARERVREVLRQHRGDRSIADLSRHILAAARVPE